MIQPGLARNAPSRDAHICLCIMSTPERFQFRSGDGLSTACEKWSGHHEPRGVVQIANGLGEHMGRYAELAKALVEDELVVYGNDHMRIHIDRYHSAGLTSVSHDFYSGGRHEMLHEINRRDVISNLLVWMSGVLEKMPS